MRKFHAKIFDKNFQAAVLLTLPDIFQHWGWVGFIKHYCAVGGVRSAVDRARTFFICIVEIKEMLFPAHISQYHQRRQIVL